MTPLNGIYIWDVGSREAAGVPPSPEDLPPAWTEDLRALGPWEDLPAPGAGLSGRWRRAAGQRLEQPLIISPDCSSSLDLARQLHSAGLFPDWASVLAVRQWAGRGRQGRSWESPAGNIHAALRLPWPDAAWRGSLPLAVAVAIAASLSDFGVGLLVKWPNDLLLAGRKVGGILIEEREGFVLAGIGLNLASAPPAGRLRHEQSLPAGSLADLGHAFSPLTLWRHVSESCRARIAAWLARESPRSFVGLCERHLAYLKKEVIVSPTNGGPEFRALVLGTDPSGGLRVRSDKGDMLVTLAGIYPIAT